MRTLTRIVALAIAFAIISPTVASACGPPVATAAKAAKKEKKAKKAKAKRSKKAKAKKADAK